MSSLLAVTVASKNLCRVQCGQRLGDYYCGVCVCVITSGSVCSVCGIAFSEFSSVYIHVYAGCAGNAQFDFCCAELVVHQQGEADPSLLLGSGISRLCLAPSHAPGRDHHGRHPAMVVDTSANLLSFRLTLVIELFRTSANGMSTCTFHRSSAEPAQAGWTASQITSH